MGQLHAQSLLSTTSHRLPAPQELRSNLDKPFLHRPRPIPNNPELPTLPPDASPSDTPLYRRVKYIHAKSQPTSAF